MRWAAGGLDVGGRRWDARTGRRDVRCPPLGCAMSSRRTSHVSYADVEVSSEDVEGLPQDVARPSGGRPMSKWRMSRSCVKTSHVGREHIDVLPEDDLCRKGARRRPARGRPMSERRIWPDPTAGRVPSFSRACAGDLRCTRATEPSRHLRLTLAIIQRKPEDSSLPKHSPLVD
jgi:hypothetical protein